LPEGCDVREAERKFRPMATGLEDLELPEIEDQTAFNLALWDELVDDFPRPRGRPASTFATPPCERVD
jgi:hypothetical protein